MSSYGKEWKTSQPFELDYNEQLRQAYYDCVTAFNALETHQFSTEGTSIFENTVSINRFCASVDVLTSMIVDTMKDPAYTKLIPDDDSLSFNPEEQIKGFIEARRRFKAVSELFQRKDIFKPARTVKSGRL